MSTHRRETRQKPNIIFVMADDLGYGDLGCYGAEKIQTPNIDLLAAEGIRFTDAHSSSAVCTPSRYSVLTGRYCWRSRLKEWVLWGFEPPLIEPERLTVASMLKERGYATVAIGKWHLGLGWTTRDGQEPLADGTNVDYSVPITGGPLDLGFDTCSSPALWTWLPTALCKTIAPWASPLWKSAPIIPSSAKG
jgi:arylsulfatase A-like enzyme